MKYMIQFEEDYANDILKDNNNIQGILFISYSLKISKLVIIILNITYLIGMFWLILQEFLFDYVMDAEELTDNLADIHDETFFYQFGIYDKTKIQKLIIGMYFAFTSLSTVGFGDYHPRGNTERLVGACILLFGVAIFSYIMGNFIDILNQFKEFNKELDDGDNLTKFFGILKKFNGQEHIRL